MEITQTVCLHLCVCGGDGGGGGGEGGICELTYLKKCLGPFGHIV